MPKLSNLFFLFFVLFSARVSAQPGNQKTSFNLLVSAMGDLNGDKVTDSVAVLQDTVNERSPYRLQVFLASKAGVYDLALQSDSAIAARYPDGRDAFLTGTDFSDITIKNGVLSINVELLRGHYTHKFRYQKGTFALIGFSETYSDGQGIMTTTDFNLSTGAWQERVDRYDTDKLLSKKNKKIMVRPLPDLKRFKPHETTLY